MEREAYHQIMKDKQELLSFDSKIFFVFAHSALREGWDNPNVFVICLLKEPLYDAENQRNTRRQELGRGLRICVNQQGERVKDEDANILTVVCPEDFSEYVDALQHEYVSTNDIIPPNSTDARRTKAVRNDSIFNSSAFTYFWRSISRETNYEIILTKGEFVITTYTFESRSVSSSSASISLIITDTRQRHNQYFRRDYPKGFDFGRYCKDVNLRGLRLPRLSKATQAQ